MAERRTVGDLVKEVMDLKLCQIDIVKISIGLFTFVTSVVGVIIGITIKTNIINQFDNINPMILYIFIMMILTLLMIAPISLPIFMRIIIHKCRSIFRLIGYIRLSEEIDYSSNNSNIIPFEFGYSKLRYHPLFLKRIQIDETKTILNRWFNDIKSKLWKEILGKNWEEIKGLELGELKVYTGRYYCNIWFFLKLLSAIHLLIYMVIVIIINFMFSSSNLFCVLINSLSIILLVWCVYNMSLIRRYFKEIHYYPFSIGSWYCLFKILNEDNNIDRYDRWSDQQKDELIDKFKNCLRMGSTP